MNTISGKVSDAFKSVNRTKIFRTGIKYVSVTSASEGVFGDEKGLVMNWRPARWALVAGALLMIFPALRGSESGRILGAYIERQWSNVREAWNHGNSELILNGFAYHSPSSYSETQLQHLNSKTWGAGLSRDFTDPDGNRHQIYLMGFSDSHYKPEFHVGFSWLHPVFRCKYELVVEAGYTAFIFLRKDSILSSDYAPSPGVLPLVTFGGSSTKLNMTWIPPVGRRVQGDVYYFFLSQRL